MKRSAARRRSARVVVKDVKRKSLPALDDAFAREVGDFDTLDALRAAVRVDMGSTRSGKPMPTCAASSSRRSSKPIRSRCPNSWVNQLIEGYMQMYGVPDAEKQRFAAGVPAHGASVRCAVT